MSEPKTADLCLAPGQTVREALAAIDTNRRGIVLVTADDGRLRDTLTDGDLRRAILKGASLDTLLHRVLELKHEAAGPTAPLTALEGTDGAALLALMRRHTVRQIPLVDDSGRPTGLVTLDDLVPAEPLALQAVIMAGGFGTRLQPLTHEMPKPMLPVGDKPLLEHIVNQLQQSGIRRVNMTTHYMPEVIRGHFGDGRDFGLDIQYVNEDEPLGTAGALSLLTEATEPILLINGDILTRVDFRAMLAFHREHRADVTVGVREYDFRVPYGVVQCEGENVLKIEEKPVYRFFVNAGIYLLEPSAQRAVPQDCHCDMTDLIEKLAADKRPVVAYPIVEYWLDIGRLADYERAQQDVKSGEFKKS